jgi:hypothetical protein
MCDCMWWYSQRLCWEDEDFVHTHLARADAPVPKHSRFYLKHMLCSTLTNAKCNAKGSHNRPRSRYSPRGWWVGPSRHLLLACILIELAGVRPTWKRLIDGHCGIVNIRDRNPKFASLPSQVAGVIPLGEKVEGGWDPKEWLQPGVSDAQFNLHEHCVDYKIRMSEKWHCSHSMLCAQQQRLSKMRTGCRSLRRIFKQPYVGRMLFMIEYNAKAVCRVFTLALE